MRVLLYPIGLLVDEVSLPRQREPFLKFPRSPETHTMEWLSRKKIHDDHYKRFGTSNLDADPLRVLNL
jgi:hypothetical protein